MVGLFLMGILLWSLVVAAAFLAFIGLWKRSWKALAWSGVALLLPTLLISMDGQGIWFSLAILLPLLLFAAAFLMKKQHVRSL